MSRTTGMKASRLGLALAAYGLTTTAGGTTPDIACEVIAPAEGEAFQQDAQWSPDGAWIAYSEYRPAHDRYDPADWSIRISSIDCATRQLVAENAQFVSWSPRGDALAFASPRDGDRDIYVVALAPGSQPRQLTNNVAQDSHPAWSPRGDTIAFVSDRNGLPQIYLLDLVSGETRQLTRSEGRDNNPQWSPDGRQLVFFRESAGGDRIMLVDPVTGAESEPAQAEGSNHFPAFTPDGAAIVYSSMVSREEPSRLMLSDIGMDATRTLALPPAFFARISPDGARVASVAGRWPNSRLVVAPFPGAATPSAGDAVALRAWLASEMDARTGAVVLAARHGRVLLHEAFGFADVDAKEPMSADDIFGIGSITKQFTAVAVLQLVDEGRLRLDDDVRTLLPELRGYNRAISVEQLLTHTSGLPNILDRPDFEDFARSERTPGELLAATAHLPLVFSPGRSFRYSDTGYFALGVIIERLSGMNYGDYIEQRIFRPLGMEDSAYLAERRLPDQAAGYSIGDGGVVPASHISMTIPYAAGSLGSTAADLLRWHMALRAGRIVPARLLGLAWAGRTLPDGTPSGYGFGFQTCELSGYRTIEHGGYVNGYLANAMFFPDDDLDIIVLMNNDAAEPDASTLARRLARRILTGAADVATISLGTTQRTRLTGSYMLSNGRTLTIIDRDGMLYGRTGDGPERRLAALSSNRLIWHQDGESIQLSFEPEDGERAERLRASLRCEPLYSGRHVR